MRVLVIGANGQIGRHVIHQLQSHPQHEPVAMVRATEQAQAFKKQGVATQLVDLEGSLEDLTEAVSQADAVVFTAGSGGHTGADQTMMIDMDGAIKAMQAARQAEVSRFIIVSAIGVHHRHKWMSAAPYYSAAKHYADEWLRGSGLDYTIIRPGRLTNEAGTQKVQIAADLNRGDIPREDVAAVIVSALSDHHAVGKAFDLTSGEQMISAALSQL